MTEHKERAPSPELGPASATPPRARGSRPGWALLLVLVVAVPVASVSLLGGDEPGRAIAPRIAQASVAIDAPGLNAEPSCDRIEVTVRGRVEGGPADVVYRIALASIAPSGRTVAVRAPLTGVLEDVGGRFAHTVRTRRPRPLGASTRVRVGLRPDGRPATAADAALRVPASCHGPRRPPVVR